MDEELPEVVNVLLAAPGSERYVDRIRAIAPERLELTPVFSALLPELRQQWPESTLSRYARGAAEASDIDLEAAVREAHVALINIPFPKTLPARAPNLRLAHWTRAGVDALRGTDWWQPSFPVSCGRGYMGVVPIAEMAIAGAMMLAKRLNHAVDLGREGELQISRYGRPTIIDGKTMGIIGLGAIGSKVAQMAKALGLRVIATRHSAQQRQKDVDGVDELFPSRELPDLLQECDFVTVCAPLTAETEGMLDANAFAAMKPGAYLVNIARGEIVVETALIDALTSGQIRGAYLDVWQDDMTEPPSAALRGAPNLVLTPHISGVAEGPYHFTIDVFCDNIARLLKGEPLRNVVDWQKGY